MIGFTACNLFPTSQKKERQGRRVVCFQENLREKVAGGHFLPALQGLPPTGRGATHAFGPFQSGLGFFCKRNPIHN
jgi:hypothetical protein